MNNYKYSNPKVFEMQKFLEHIYEIARSNPEMEFDLRTVYRELKRYGLRKEDMKENRELLDLRGYFEEWFYKLNGYNRNLQAYGIIHNNYHWALFKNGEPKTPYIKMYISLDSDHIQYGITQLFGFISTLDVVHTSKVSQELRSDGIVIRVSQEDMASAFKILDYVNNNPYIKEGMLEPNPFVPSVGKVGWMTDYGRGYNLIISEHMSSYINKIVKENKLPSIQDFYDQYISNANNVIPSDISSHEMAIDIKDAFEIAGGIKPRTIEGSDIAYLKSGNITQEQKRALFLDALKATYSQFGTENTIYAIREIIENNNYNYISNGDTKIKYRDILQDILLPGEVERYIVESMKNINPQYGALHANLLIREFVNCFLSQNVVMKFSEICNVTYNWYGKNWLNQAIHNYVFNNDPTGFKRHINNDENGINYRVELSKIDRLECVNAMKFNLYLHGINTNSNTDIDEIIDMYVNTLERAKYSESANVPKI